MGSAAGGSGPSLKIPGHRHILGVHDLLPAMRAKTQASPPATPFRLEVTEFLPAMRAKTQPPLEVCDELRVESRGTFASAPTGTVAPT